MLRIGFDAKRLFNNFTGLGNYSRTLVHDLHEWHQQNEYFLFTPKVKNKNETKEFFNDDYKLIKPKNSFGAYWRSFSIKKDLEAHDIDIYHGLSHEIPFGIQKTNIASIVTIHDLIYKFQPQDFSFIDRKIYNKKFKYACDNADRIVAISKSTKLDIVQNFNIDPEKIDVVYQTCSDIFKRNISPLEKEQIKKKYALPEQYLLYVGSIVERKNLLTVVKTINQTKSFLKIPLVVIGNGKEYKAKIEQYIKDNNLEKHIVFLKNVSYQDLPAIYSLSKIFIYPSRYEGFGIPIVEALWTRTPVITTNCSSLPEAAGSGAHYVAPDDVAGFAEGIIKLLTNKDYYVKLMNNGFSHVQKFKSQVIANEMIDVYKKTVL